MGIDVTFFKNISFSHSSQAGLTTPQNWKRRKKCRTTEEGYRKEASHVFYFQKKREKKKSLCYLAASYKSVFYFVAL